MMNDLPAGIWYEAPRKRYRVRVYCRQNVIHRSYHSTRAEAFAAHQKALELKHKQLLFRRDLDTIENQLAELLQKPQEPSRGNPLMAQLLTVERFLELYYEEGSRPAKCTIYRLIRAGKLSARRVGRGYYITTDDAEAFVSGAASHAA